MTYSTYADTDTGACYTCYAEWLPGEPEWHRDGCPRELDPVGAPEPATCYECGAREILGACTNEGQCRRWRDVVGEMEFDGRADDEPPLHGEAVAAAREAADDPFFADSLDDLPFLGQACPHRTARRYVI